MIYCKGCGANVLPQATECPVCKEKITLSVADIIKIRDKIAEAKELKNYELAYLYTEALVNHGYTPAQREWGMLLESGDLGAADLDKAMQYFYLATLKNDPYSTYRYSRLLGRVNEAASKFWLEYAAVLGCTEAFVDMAKHLDTRGLHGDATYFYTLAAKSDNISAITTLAKRYYDGILVEKSEPYAKWYIDMLAIPPISAIKLAYKLRSVVAEEPPEDKLSSHLHLLKALKEKASDMKFTTAQRRLLEILSEHGDRHALAELGIVYAEGVGGETKTEEALTCLKKAAAEGVGEAYKTLGMLYLSGFSVNRDTDIALKYFNLAAKSGYPSAYEIMGDIYYHGEHVDKDIEKAAELYEKASNEGSTEAGEKLQRIIKMRTIIYKDALSKENTNPKEAFILLNKSVAMGHVASYQRLARAYLLGIGTKAKPNIATALLKRAVELGDDTAIYPLGMCYLKGIGIKQSYKHAYNLLKRAEALGIDVATAHINAMLDSKQEKLKNRLYSKGIRLLYSQKLTPAMQAFEAAHRKGCARATYTLGCFYEFGLGVTCDKDMAYELYEEAFRNKFRDPRASYKLIVLKLIKNTIKKK